MIVVHEALQVTVQTPFAEHNYLVQALAADGADDPFDISPLPGGPRCRQHLVDPVWPENSIRRIPSSTKGYISVRNFGICESASAPETPRITQETPKSWTRRIPPARQPFMTDTSVAAVTTARLDRAGEVGHCWFIQPAREISRKRNGSRHFDIGSSHYRRSQGSSPAVSDRSSFRAIRGC